LLIKLKEKFIIIFLTLIHFQIEQQNLSCKFEEEIRQEQEEKKRQAEEAKERKKAFKEKANMFNQA